MAESGRKQESEERTHFEKTAKEVRTDSHLNMKNSYFLTDSLEVWGVHEVAREKAIHRWKALKQEIIAK